MTYQSRSKRRQSTRLARRHGSRAGVAIFATICASLLLTSPASASFGLKGATATAINRDGSVDLQAGSHPYEYKLSFAMNRDSKGDPEGALRDLVVDLPAGMLANSQAVPRCSGADFEGQTPSCPANTQVGVVRIDIAGLGPTVSPVYNLTPPLGVAGRVGFSALGDNGFEEASLRTGGDYGITLSDITVPHMAITSITETIWGVPADAGHDGERGNCLEGGGSCPTDTAPAPFLTLPTSCTGPLRTTVSVDSIEEPGVFQSESALSLGEGGTPEGLNSCERPPFDPTITAQPETTVADSPTGLHVDIHMPQDEDPEGLASANMGDAVVTLPAGVVVDASAADGLGACGPEQVDLKGSGPAQCPDSAKIGTAMLNTPLLDHPLAGAVYLAKQGENPFGSLLALYIAVDDPLSGVVVKLAGEVDADPVTGQLKASFLNNPQLPLEDFDLDFFGGPRAVLTTPSTCGAYLTTSGLTPWTAPEGATVTPAASFQITSAPAGGACPATPPQEPNAPSFDAGTVVPLAGAYSPFVLRLGRENGSQRLQAVNVTLPPGLMGKLAGVQRCSDAQVAGAAARSNPGEGATEQSNPSCPAASEVGTVTVRAGSGSPLAVAGHAYLAGPYEGAPFSLATVAPAVAGPFDLGNVVVRWALYINPETAQVTIKSDPIPTIMHGIPLDVRSFDVALSRPEFILNPTSCETMTVGGEAISALGQVALLSKRFQVGGCQGLAFSPKLTALTYGDGEFTGHGASLHLKITNAQGQANMRSLKLDLPQRLPARLETIQQACPQRVFKLNPAACPRASVIGSATVATPVLDEAMRGPAILVSHGGAAFPDMVLVLQAQGVRIDLTGALFVDQKNVTSTTFRSIPDVPIRRLDLVLPEGPRSVLAASASLCAKPLRMTTAITGQNGARVKPTVKVAVAGCKHKKKRHATRRRRKQKRHSTRR
jgi:hypothetical protein